MKIKNYLWVVALTATMAGLLAPVSGASAMSKSASYDAPGGDRSGMFYLGMQGGLNFLTVSTTDGGTSASDHEKTGFVIGGDLGYYFTNNIRTDLSIDYARNNLKAPAVGGHIGQTFVLVNAYYDIPMDSFTPYLGAGLGFAHIKYAGATDPANDFSENGFGWQVGAGLKYEVMDNLDIGVGYRLQVGISRKMGLLLIFGITKC